MKYGVAIFPTDQALRIDLLARAAEERGLESLFVCEHSHIPASRRTPWPVGGGELPREYWAMLDPLVALGMAAGATRKLLLGTAVCLVMQRDPIILAKETASLDFLSGGRFVFGIGAGWNAEEMENHGVAFASRWDIAREKTEAIKAIWTSKDAGYHGKWVNFDPIWSEPKPAQKPHPPILFGGQGIKAMRAAIGYCDGWLPALTPDFAVAVTKFRHLAQDSRRDPKSLHITAIWAAIANGWSAPDGAVLQQSAAAGADRLICGVPPSGSDAAMRWLDEYARVIDRQSRS
ncbi:MAG TPA: LLM class F420-dependent oxidoreductase [Candidatus Binataceae bacterium]|nr:LLM class F420-dependent oxidoreductase [Candidatus Binataceae bacterium]